MSAGSPVDSGSMRHFVRFLAPILLIVCAALCEGAPRVTTSGRLGFLLQATVDVPVSWKLPEGWFASPPREAHGGLVRYVSGPEPTLWARIHSWPVEAASDNEMTARLKLQRILMPGLVPAGARTARGVAEFQMLGWGESTDPAQNRGTPDTIAIARGARVGDRLVAVFVAGKPKGSLITQQQMEGLLQSLRFERALTRSVAFRYGAIVQPAAQ